MTDKNKNGRSAIKFSRTERRILELLNRYFGAKVAAAAFFVMAIGIVLIFISFGKTAVDWQYFALLELGKALLITALITLPIRWFLIKQSEQIVKEENEIIVNNIMKNFLELRSQIEGSFSEHNDMVVGEIKKHDKVMSNELSLHDECVQDEIKSITHSSSSLIALSNVYASNIYDKRNKASEDILSAIQSKNVDRIQLIGISLNDITRDENKDFHKIWKILQKIIEGKYVISHKNKLKIQMLIIDPASEGAYLRASAEETEGAPSRLYRDVWGSMEKFYSTKKKVTELVEFDVKLYRLPPILFMVRTNNVSYVQQYYFRPSHEANVSIPFLKYHSSDNSNERTIHDELENHFNWIWDSASISLEEYIENYSRGTFRACLYANISNIFLEERIREIQDKNRSRMGRLKHLIGKTKKRLWIKGITLRSYFSLESDLYKVILKVCRQSDIDVRILLLDPECRQAKIRSFREYLLKHHDADLDSFDQTEREGERLYRETNVTFDNIKHGLIPSLAEESRNNIKIGVYSSAPEAFLLLTDDYVLVEQYHYGQIVADTGVLGRNVPLVEYKKQDDGIYNIFEDHFNYVLKFWTELKKYESNLAESNLDKSIKEPEPA
jgi:hypothetical protein